MEPAAGKVNLNIYAMARSGLRECLPGLISRAQSQGGAAQCGDAQVIVMGKRQSLTVAVQLILHPESLRDRLLVVFQNVGKPMLVGKGREEIAAAPQEGAARELQESREAMQVMREQMQASLDELTSSNEELQSTNEELTTAKEEMMSMNEELQIAIADRQAKMDSLSLVQSDMDNLHDNTEISAVFLNSDMQVRRYTHGAAKFFKLRPGDVGRKLSDLAGDLDYPRLIEDAEGVLENLTILEQDVDSRDGRRCRVRITPYRTQDNMIDGVVVTFADIRRSEASASMFGH